MPVWALCGMACRAAPAFAGDSAAERMLLITPVLTVAGGYKMPIGVNAYLRICISVVVLHQRLKR